MKSLMRSTVFTVGLFLSATVGTAQAESIRATLSGSEEVPVVATSAKGEFRGFINRGDQSIDFELTYSGLQGAATTQAHIHVAQPGVNGGIVIWFCGSPSNPGPLGTPPCTDGSGKFVGTINPESVVAISGANAGQQIGAEELAKVIAAMRAGNTYVNVHTDASSGGEIRGQIRSGRRNR
jgi:hypothetical protein